MKPELSGLLVSVVVFWLTTSVAPAQKAPPASSGPVHYGFGVEWSRDRTSSKSSDVGPKGDAMAGVTVNTYVGHVKITNKSTIPLTDLEVRVQTHYKSADPKGAQNEHVDFTKTINLAKNETITLDTAPLKLQSVELKNGYYFKNNASGRQADSIRGAVVTFLHGGQEVFQYFSNPALKSEVAKPATTKK